jgi:capsular polysaccharide biosynthesis protein
VDLITFWNVVKRRQRIVVIGLCIAGALALVSLIKPTAEGLAWRTPPVYDAKATVEVTKPGFQGRLGNPTADLNTSTFLVQQASFYANRAEGYQIARAAGRKIGIEEPAYDVVRLAGDDGTALPLLQITAYETSPKGAVDVANGVSKALIAYVLRDQESDRISARNRIELQVFERAREAEVFQGLRMTRPIMLFLLGALLTFGVAFVVDNLRGGRDAVPAEPSGEPEAPLGIVRNDPEPEDEPQEEEEDEDEQPPAARGRWAAPS